MQLCMGWKGHNIGFFFFSSFINLWLEDSLFPFSCFYIFLLFSMIFFSDWLFFSTDWTCATNSAIVFLPLVGVIYETCFFCFLLVFMDSLMSLSLGSTYIIMKHIEGGALFAECLVGGAEIFWNRIFGSSLFLRRKLHSVCLLQRWQFSPPRLFTLV